MIQKGLAPILIVLILAALVGGYLIYQRQAKLTPQPSSENLPPLKEIEKGHPKLESVLYQLTQAKNYKAFANSNGLEIQDNKVFVTIEVNNPNYRIPPEFGTETARASNLIDAYIRIDMLLQLANDQNIFVIRQPITASPL